ncbi:hypothetical protein GCM10011371_20050 [Novosphingobium marinum]|uniref:Uncharacterized protein n=1 Tax=Novosphingobium marinum TaxID=1514948 RepID=A0A7Y9XX14_9SPHN|nr:hypothetical protein [Novosphingobium marinum]NYH96117.1 hypothetical protein [Novosphingobium marinum]GGC32626.1 hypothetical protein GCM10011371_20050 [Novosphingobium marinum]
MDLNELYARHQTSLIRAADTDDDSERDRHNAEADAMASCIEERRIARGARAAPLLPAEQV